MLRRMTQDTEGLLLGLAVQGVLAAARAVFLHFKSTRVIAAVLFRDVISFFTLGTRQRNYRTNIFLGSHSNLNCRKLRHSLH